MSIGCGFWSGERVHFYAVIWTELHEEVCEHGRVVFREDEVDSLAVQSCRTAL